MNWNYTFNHVPLRYVTINPQSNNPIQRDKLLELYSFYLTVMVYAHCNVNLSILSVSSTCLIWKKQSRRTSRLVTTPVTMTKSWKKTQILGLVSLLNNSLCSFQQKLQRTSLKELSNICFAFNCYLRDISFHIPEDGHRFIFSDEQSNRLLHFMITIHQ